MIIFESVEWKNFLSTGNSSNKVLLNRSTTTLIIGKNGEGKSTILDALCFGLFGKPFRNVKKGQLVNSINGKNCLVTVEFSINGVSYKVVRGIKPNKFEIYQNDQLMNQDAAARDYQKVLEQQILRLNYKTFTQVVILGSASFVPFMQLSSWQRREVIEDILDIKIFSTMNQLLKERTSGTKDEIKNVEADITNAKTKVESQSQLIKTITEAKADNIKELEEKIEANTQTIARTQGEIETLLSEIAGLTEEISHKTKLTNDANEAHRISHKLQDGIEKLEESISFYSGNDVCPTCTQSIDLEFKQKQVDDLQTKKVEMESKTETLKKKLFKIESDMEHVSDISDKISEKNVDVSTKNQTVTILNRQNAEMMSEIETKRNDTANVDEEKSKLKELAKQAMGKIEHRKNLLSERNMQEIASLLLKDNGIKTSIIREYLPIMNKLINKYLQAMDAYIHFDLDENFNEVVKSRFRDEFTYASFSEGEKMRIDLAILFTWRQIAKMKNSVNTNLLLLDEIFDSSLDTAGTDYFLSLMETFGENSNIFVISHKGDQLFEKFRSVIKFEKRNDFSVISNG